MITVQEVVFCNRYDVERSKRCDDNYKCCPKIRGAIIEVIRDPIRLLHFPLTSTVMTYIVDERYSFEYL